MTEPLADRWQCRGDYTPPAQLIDPRITIARHIDWVRPSCGETDFSVPEPDNYNRSILDVRAHDCEFVENQVFYWDQYRRAWISVYYVPDSQLARFDSWVSQIKPQAIWSSKARRLRQHRGLLWAPKNAQLQLNERLYSMGYYDSLNKYGDTDLFSARLGPARARIDQLLDAEPQAES